MSRVEVRTRRIRAKIRKVSSRPRLTVFMSNKYIYGQIIDDAQGMTLVAANTLQKPFAGLKQKSNVAAATAIGQQIGKTALEKKITHVVFDKGGYKYHGKVKALADAVKEVGVVI